MSTPQATPDLTDAPLQRWRVGDVSITAVLEHVWDLERNWLVPDATPEQMVACPWLHPDHVGPDGRLRLFIQALVIDAGDTRVVVDTCIGADKPRAAPRFDRAPSPWLDRMEAAGISPASVDVVLCTHLHFDHVGWNTRLVDGRWVPTFPDARYLISRAEWTRWERVARDHLDDSVRPVFDAGLVDLIDPPHAITEAVRVVASPGHTPGHVCVHVTSGDAQAVLTGDALHHPIQCAHPDWPCAADDDPDQARRTRRALLTDCATQRALMIGAHFAAPSAGLVLPDGDAWRLVPPAAS